MYRRLTELHLKLDSRTDSAAAWVEASRAYNKAGNATGANVKGWHRHCPRLACSLQQSVCNAHISW